MDFAIFLLFIIFAIGFISWCTSGGSKTKERYSLVRARDNLALVKEAQYRRKAIMNNEESVVFRRLCDAVEKQFGQPRLGTEGFFIFPQISLGSFVWVPRESEDGRWQFRSEREWQAAASSRPDFVITTYNLQPALTVEYNGEGRYVLRRPEEREISDQIKELVHQKIGIQLLRISANEPPEQYCERVVAALGSYIDNSRKQ